MCKIIPKSGIVKILLISFILLCSVFTCENLFSRKHWQRENIEVIYNKNEKYITFNILVYDYWFLNYGQYGFLQSCHIFCSEDDKSYSYLMSVRTEAQEEKNWTWMEITSKKPGEKIYLINCYQPAIGTLLPEDSNIKVKVNAKHGHEKDGQGFLETKRSYIKIKWRMSPSSKPIKFIKVFGEWKVRDEVLCDKFEEHYSPVIERSNSKTMKNASSEFKSEISDHVKITGNTDAISVSGAKTDKISRFIMLQGQR